MWTMSYISIMAEEKGKTNAFPFTIELQLNLLLNLLSIKFCVCFAGCLFKGTDLLGRVFC